MYRWYHEGLNIFQEPNPAAGRVYEQLKKKLKLSMSMAETGYASFLETTKEISRDENIQIKEGRDRLAELISSGFAEGEAIAKEILENDNPTENQAYFEELIDCLGLECEDHSEFSVVVKPSNHMTIEQFLPLKEEGELLCFDRDKALFREDMQFLTLGHPLFYNAMESILTNGIGCAAVGLLKPDHVKLNNIKTSQILIETVFTLAAAGDDKSSIEFFLPIQTIHKVINEKFISLEDKLTTELLTTKLTKLPYSVAKKFLKSTRFKRKGYDATRP